jgi:protein-S-isoprenylcysteine O-methyltransferase Ste14
MILIGLTIIVIGVKTFHNSDTTVNPLNPSEASHLVTEGVFSYTRNPMYLGMVIILLGVSIYNGVYIGIIILPCFIFYITEFQIKPEEEAMVEIFAGDYTDYLKRVRRWL